MKGIDKQTVRQLFEEIGLPLVEDEDGDFVFLQTADSNFPHDVVVYVFVHNNRLSYAAGAPTFKPQGNLLELANRHNCNRTMPTAVVRGENIRLEATFLLDEEVSKEYITENCIKLVLGAIWQAFISLQD